jgi:hypothetical protein
VLFRSTPQTAWISQISENSFWQKDNDPCSILLGSGWRIPTSNEWELLYVFQGWASNPSASVTFSSAMRIHAGGWLRREDGELAERSTRGWFWTGNQGLSTVGYGISFTNEIFLATSEKTLGLSLRCIYN